MSKAHEFELSPFGSDDGPDTAEAIEENMRARRALERLPDFFEDYKKTEFIRSALRHFSANPSKIKYNTPDMEHEPKTYYITEWNPGHPLKDTGIWVIDMIEVKDIGEIPNLQDESQRPTVLRCKIPQRLVIGHPADEGYLTSKIAESGGTYFQALFHPDPSIAELQHLRLRERLKQPIVI